MSTVPYFAEATVGCLSHNAVGAGFLRAAVEAYAIFGLNVS